MFKKLCICIVMLFPVFAFSQEEIPVENLTISDTTKMKSLSHEIGVSATSLLFQFLKSDNENVNQNPYLLTYKLIARKKYALRLGVGYDFFQNERFIDGTSDKVTNTLSSIDARLGVEYRKYFGKKWMGTFGVDGIFRSTLDELLSDTAFDRVTILTDGIGFGGGAVIGLQVHLTDKLMLGTEGAFYFLNMETTTDTIFETSTQFNSDPEVATDFTSETFLPSTIYLIFRF